MSLRAPPVGSYNKRVGWAVGVGVFSDWFRNHWPANTTKKEYILYRSMVWRSFKGFDLPQVYENVRNIKVRLKWIKPRQCALESELSPLTLPHLHPHGLEIKVVVPQLVAPAYTLNWSLSKAARAYIRSSFQETCLYPQYWYLMAWAITANPTFATNDRFDFELEGFKG